MELGSKRAQVYYRAAQLSRPAQGADRATNQSISATLERAIALDPEFANALSFLADVKSDLGESEEAVGLAQKAVKIEPDSPYHRLAFARALWNAGRASDAIAAARSALTVADEEAERSYAQRFLDFALKSSPPPRTRPSPGPTRPAPTGAPTTPLVLSGAPGSGAIPVASGMSDAADACFAKRDDAACAKVLPVLAEACRRNEGYSCRALGSLYDGGFGIPMDKARAGAAYDAGCREARDQASCARYAVLQVQGIGVQRDSVAGLATLDRLCGEKVDDACIGWALILAVRPERPDVPKARALLQASCDAGNAEGCRLLKTLPAR
jgi:tetratricopeptide (TPR) repeat protein